jgi:hypothetical protein
MLLTSYLKIGLYLHIHKQNIILTEHTQTQKYNNIHVVIR